MENSNKQELTESANAAENEPVQTVKKTKRDYEWTPKRKEAFEKMREGLSKKVELTKQVKAEKKQAEKDDLKRRVREIMQRGGKLENEESNDVDSGESEVDIPAPKEKKSAKSVKELPKKEIKKKKRAATPPPSSSEDSESEMSVDSDDYEERIVSTHKQRTQQRHQKDSRGKAPRQTVFQNPLDRFILL